jgi:hypothetical protein
VATKPQRVSDRFVPKLVFLHPLDTNSGTMSGCT